jgi:hypothetical protein
LHYRASSQRGQRCQSKTAIIASRKAHLSVTRRPACNY